MNKQPKNIKQALNPLVTDEMINASHIAAYTASMLTNLARMTREAELTVLSYLIEMAKLEAESNI